MRRQWDTAWLPLSLPNRPLNPTFATHLPTDLPYTRQIGEEAARTEQPSCLAAAEAAFVSLPNARAHPSKKVPHETYSSGLANGVLRKFARRGKQFEHSCCYGQQRAAITAERSTVWPVERLLR